MESHPGGDTTQPHTTASQLQLAALASLTPLHLAEALPDVIECPVPVAQLAACPAATSWALSTQQLGAADSVPRPQQAAAGAAAAGAGNAGRDWCALPASALCRIFCLAYTWQVPGSCLAAPVCRQWRAAAAGCRGIRLLYCADNDVKNQAFAAWLGANSPQLEALSISSSDGICPHTVLCALGKAATAAAASGCPLSLHTLRLFQYCFDPAIASQLLQGLPHLRCLQIDIDRWWSVEAIQEFMDSLQQATQVRELYLKGCPFGDSCEANQNGNGAQQLPATLQRLSWCGDLCHEVPDLSHLDQVGFLQLQDWCAKDSDNPGFNLPPNLRELQLLGIEAVLPAALQQERGLLTRYRPYNRLTVKEQLQLLTSFTKLSYWGIGDARKLVSPRVCADMQNLVNLSGLWVKVGSSVLVQPVVTAAASLGTLRCLYLSIHHLKEAPGLAALTHVTRLEVLFSQYGDGWEQHASSWAAQLSGMSWLRWLSVPALLLVAHPAWLQRCSQLRVLVLEFSNLQPGRGQGEVLAHMQPRVIEWLEWCGLPRRVLPPQLLLLGSSTAHRMLDFQGHVLDVVPQQVWRRLQQRLSSTGCEVLVRKDLHELFDPAKQLAGLPVALQQALA